MQTTKSKLNLNPQLHWIHWEIVKNSETAQNFDYQQSRNRNLWFLLSKPIFGRFQTLCILIGRNVLLPSYAGEAFSYVFFSNLSHVINSLEL